MISYSALHYFVWGLIITGLGWALGSYAWDAYRERRSYHGLDQMHLYMLTLTPEQRETRSRRRRLAVLFGILVLTLAFCVIAG